MRRGRWLESQLKGYRRKEYESPSLPTDHPHCRADCAVGDRWLGSFSCSCGRSTAQPPLRRVALASSSRCQRERAPGGSQSARAYRRLYRLSTLGTGSDSDARSSSDFDRRCYRIGTKCRIISRFDDCHRPPPAAFSSRVELATEVLLARGSATAKPSIICLNFILLLSSAIVTLALSNARP